MDSRKKLIHLLELKEKLDKEIEDAKEEYLIQYEGKPLIWITDHCIIRYLERVKGLTIPIEYGNDPEKMQLYRYAREKKLDIEQIRKEILSDYEMKCIVKQNINEYEKQDFKVIIRNLAATTVIPEWE